MSTFQEKQLKKQQTSKVWSAKLIEYSPFQRTNRPFIPLLMFSFTLQRLVSEKLHFKRKNPTFPRAVVKKREYFKISREFRTGKPFLVGKSWFGQEFRHYQPIRFKDLGFWPAVMVSQRKKKCIFS